MSSLLGLSSSPHVCHPSSSGPAAALRPPHASQAVEPCPDLPVLHRIVEALAMMLMQAVELRARCLEHLAGLLTPRQMAYVLIAPCDMLQLA